MRRAFTLIELVVVIVIMSVMVTVGIVSIRAGKRSSQLAGATRDVVALMRRARSTALITQRPSLITYSNEQADDENAIKVAIKADKLFDDSEKGVGEVRTLSGELVNVTEDEKERDSGKVKSVVETESASAETEGQSLSESLNPEFSKEIAKGLKIKVEKGEEENLSASSDGKVYKSAVSVFSTTEYVSSKYEEKKTETKAQSQENAADSSAAAGAADTMTEPVSVVWQTNGRTEPHTVWIYPDGSTPDRGLTIVVDKFGDFKVSQWAEEAD